MEHLQGDIPEHRHRERLKLRNRAEKIQHRLEYLRGRDRVLMEMYYRVGCSFTELASLTGASEVTIARRIANITARLGSGGYVSLIEYCELLSDKEQKLARDYFLTGDSIRQVAGRHRISFYRARRMLRSISCRLALERTMRKRRVVSGNTDDNGQPQGQFDCDDPYRDIDLQIDCEN